MDSRKSVGRRVLPVVVWAAVLIALDDALAHLTKLTWLEWTALMAFTACSTLTLLYREKGRQDMEREIAKARDEWERGEGRFGRLRKEHETRSSDRR